jgi:acyl-CoA reductase-like NAD-dependent aldehyde dehydrogenase
MAPSAIDSTTNNVPSLDFQGNFVQIINGKSAPTAKTRHAINPATLEAKPEVPVATQEDLDRAVEAGRAAFKKWRKVPYEERKAAVLAYADAIEKLQTEFRDLLISEQGKPVRKKIC